MDSQSPTFQHNFSHCRCSMRQRNGNPIPSVGRQQTIQQTRGAPCIRIITSLDAHGSSQSGPRLLVSAGSKSTAVFNARLLGPADEGQALRQHSRARMQVYTAVLHTQCARCCSCNEQSRCSKGPHQHCQCGNYLPDLERGVHRTWCDTCQVTAQKRQGTVGHRSRGRSLSRRRIGAHNP